MRQVRNAIRVNGCLTYQPVTLALRVVSATTSHATPTTTAPACPATTVAVHVAAAAATPTIVVVTLVLRPVPAGVDLTPVTAASAVGVVVVAVAAYSAACLHGMCMCAWGQMRTQLLVCALWHVIPGLVVDCETG